MKVTIYPIDDFIVIYTPITSCYYGNKLYENCGDAHVAHASQMKNVHPYDPAQVNHEVESVDEAVKIMKGLQERQHFINFYDIQLDPIYSKGLKRKVRRNMLNMLGYRKECITVGFVSLVIGLLIGHFL